MTNIRTFFSLSLRNPVSIYWHVSFLVWLCGPAEHSFFRPAAWHLLDALIDSRVYAKSIYPRSWSISVNLTNMSNSKGLKFITGWQVKIGENLNKALQPLSRGSQERTRWLTDLLFLHSFSTQAHSMQSSANLSILPLLFFFFNKIYSFFKFHLLTVWIFNLLLNIDHLYTSLENGLHYIYLD